MTKGKGGNQGGPWGRGPSGGSTPPPPSNDDIDDFIRKSQERFRGVMPSGNNKKGIFVLVLGLLLLWMASGVYVVEPEEEGVVLRFGQYHRTEEPGLRYHLPFPVERVLTPQVTRVQSIQIGYREMQSPTRDDSRNRPVHEEGRMLTGDNNVLIVPFSVQWKIKDAKNFLFNIRNPEGTVKDAAESAMREVISNHPLDAALAIDKQVIEHSTRDVLQAMLDEYGAGINIERVQMREVSAPEQVRDAFDDVQAAQQDQETTINRAIAYANEILPKARGESEKLIQDAMAYKAEVTNRAEGDAARFLSVYNEYKQAKDITKKRLYLEMMETIMRDMDKVIMDSKGAGVVPYMALPEIQKRQNQNKGQ